MDAEDLLTLLQIGEGEEEFAVESARAAKGRIDGVNAICSTNDNDLGGEERRDMK